MFNKKYKKLLGRIESLESYLGLAYSDSDFGEHNDREWGLLKGTKESIKQLKIKVGIKDKNRFE